jgi:hypothetical protein
MSNAKKLALSVLIASVLSVVPAIFRSLSLLLTPGSLAAVLVFKTHAHLK